MGCPGGYIEFFRVRSSVRVLAAGDPKHASWIAGAIEFMDFSHEVMLEETVVVCRQFPGLFSYKEFTELPFDRYEKMIEQTKEAQKNGR